MLTMQIYEIQWSKERIHALKTDSHATVVTTRYATMSSSFLPPLKGELPHGQQLVWKFYTILNWRESLYKIAVRCPVNTMQNDVSELLATRHMLWQLGQRLGRS